MGLGRGKRNALVPGVSTPDSGHALPAESQSVRLFREAFAPPAPLAGIAPNQCAGPAGATGGGPGFHVESARVRSSDT